MIEVYKNFYEEGFEMDGKENRIMLKKDGETLIEMIFLKGNVELRGYEKQKCLHSETVNFQNIYGIGIDFGKPLPAVFFS